ncbi:MAG: sugar transferase [Chloroflexi bacterium]|nr:sugar transferase [Chloroflexota bacterium]
MTKIMEAWRKYVTAARRKSAALRTSGYDLQWKVLTFELVVLDALAIIAGLMAAFELRITSGVFAYSAPYSESMYVILTVLSAVIWLCIFAVDGLYKRDNLLGGNVEYQQVLKACTTGIIVLIVLSFLSRDIATVSRAWLLLSWGFSIFFVLLERFVLRRVAYLLRRHGWYTARVLIVGANDQGAAMARQWQNCKTAGMEVIGFVDDFKPRGTVVLDGLEVIGRPTNLDSLARITGANEVVIVPNAVAWETFEEIVAQNGKPKDYVLRISPGFYELLTSSVAVSNKTFVPLFTINEARIVGIDANLKWLFDYGLGMLILLLTLPSQLLIAAQIKLTKWNRPILARYRTAGQGGSSFTMYKFNIGANSNRGRQKKGVNRFEKWVYSKGLDKLPQLFNVMAGNMSLIGPRPTVLGFDHADLRNACNLRTVKPGIIGPWLVGEFWTTAESQDELYYIRNWTIWLDVQILGQAALSWLNVKRSTGAQPLQLPVKIRPKIPGGQSLDLPNMRVTTTLQFTPRDAVESNQPLNWRNNDQSRSV